MLYIVGAVLWIVFSTILILAICMLSARLTRMQEYYEKLYLIAVHGNYEDLPDCLVCDCQECRDKHFSTPKIRTLNYLDCSVQDLLECPKCHRLYKHLTHGQKLRCTCGLSMTRWGNALQTHLTNPGE